MLSTDISALTYSLCGASIILAVTFLFLVYGKLKRVSRRSKACGKLTMPPDEEFPSVSVIVHDDARSWNLPDLLPRLLEQDYPAPMEVIVVNDGSRSATEEVVARLESIYPNLYMTFLPQGSRSLSRRKLAIMLGVKAARYDMVTLIGGNCLPESPLWLRAMMRHAARGKELVIGWAYPELREERSDSRFPRARAFDLVRTAVEYLAWAAAGHPWRGNANNIAFSRKLFYSHKGYASTLNLVRGDDDIWVKEVATRKNTAVELSSESMVAVLEDNMKDAHMMDKLNHEFTSRKPGRSARLTFGFASCCWWGAMGCGTAGFILGFPSIWPLVAMAISATITCLLISMRWNVASVTLKSRPLFITVPWFISVHPFYSLLYKIKGRAHSRDHFTTCKPR